ncbi:MAG: GH92 family glycosyl hydrolase [Kiritimatiellae bacterium]|nr:GH92 family glycosyl hydrolase [Kiritimatiellia bacterium]
MKAWLKTVVLSAALCGCAFGATEPHRRFVIVDFATEKVHHWDSADSNQCFAVSVPKTYWDLKKMREGVYRVVGDNGFKIVDLSLRCVTETFRHPALKGVTAVCDLPDGGFIGCVGNPHAKETRLYRFSAARELIATYHLPGIHYTRTMSNDRSPWCLLISWFKGFSRVRIDPQANTCTVEKLYPLVSGRNQFDAEPDLAGTGYWSSGGYGCELAHFTSEGRLLSRWKDPQNACFYAQVKEMPNGSVYMAHWTGHSMRDLSKGAQVVEFDSTGHVIWRLEDQQRFKSAIGLDVIDAPELKLAQTSPQACHVPGWRHCGTPDPASWMAFTNAFPACACQSHDWVKYVLTEMGTVNQMGGGGCNISTGNLYPMTARPWGFGGWAPQTKPDTHERWFYDYTEPRIYGIRQTRQPSPWIGDHGAWNFLPVVGDVSDEAKRRFSWYSHKAETRGPDRYGVYLADFDTTVELAPTLHGAAVRIVYPQTEKPGLVVNPSKGGSVKLSEDRKSVTGVSVMNVTSRTPVQQHFVLAFDCVVKDVRQLKDGALAVTFPTMARGDVVNVRIASSLISAEQARVNLSETDGKRFAEVAADARTEWNAQLSKIKVTSDDLEAKRVFYTCLYRTMLFPLAVWEKTADGKIVHWSPSANEVRPGYYYAGTGFWDTFRALFPLLNFLSPEMNAKMMEGLENCWKESGWLPEWSSPGLVNCMIGNNSASVVADAWLSGVRGGFDIQALYQALVHGANNAHPQMTAVGRCGVDFYNSKGYVPRDVGINESAARTLEYAYDDWCIARLGAALGRPKEEVDLYLKRSQNWRNVFDPARRIAVGRNKDGTFKKDFSPFDWGGDFTEGCAHHYTWSVFHDVPGLMTAMGGASAFEKRLDEIFTLPPTAGVAYYGRVIHETREMQVMNMGQYAHGNQPIQHMIYLYDWCGAWAKTQSRAREVMDRLYRPSPDGYCGDEDNGQTSAWYVWSALGFYPVCPASGSYALGAPRFARIDVTLPNGKQLHIRAPQAETGCVFNQATLEGRKQVGPCVQKNDLDKGGKFEWSVQN